MLYVGQRESSAGRRTNVALLLPFDRYHSGLSFSHLCTPQGRIRSGKQRRRQIPGRSREEKRLQQSITGLVKPSGHALTWITDAEELTQPVLPIVCHTTNVV